MTGSLLAFVFVVVCALSYSGLDFTRKALSTRVPSVPLVIGLTAGAVPIFTAWVLLSSGFAVQPGYLLPAALSVGLNIAANLAFQEAVRLSPISLTIPLLTLTPVFATLLAIPLLGEVPSGRQFLGIALVVAGAFRLNLSGDEGASPGAVWRSLAREPGALLMVLVALLWSLAFPLDKLAMARASVPLHALVLNVGIAAGLLLLLTVRGRLGDLATLRRGWRLMVLAVVLSAVALAFLLLAITELWVGVVDTFKRGIGSLLAVLLGHVLWNEGLGRQKIFAVALMVVGVALILL